MSDGMPLQSPEQEQQVLEGKPKLKKPPLYKVLLHNDNFTSMEFVVSVLISVFHKNEQTAHAIMMKVHQQGVGVAGVYTYEIAEAKIDKVTELARAREFPLMCSMEEDE